MTPEMTPAKASSLTINVGIIGAMPEEIAVLLSALTDRHDTHKAGFGLYAGKLEHLPVIIAQSGIGKVNAAILCQLLIQQGVTHIIMTGVAGALEPSLQVGDIVISRDALQHDVDVTGLGYELGLIPGDEKRWRADAKLAELALMAAQDFAEVNAVMGTIATGDVFVADLASKNRVFDTFGAACVEMEGASVAQVCHKFGVPFVIIRSISDTADDGAEVDFRAFMSQAAQRASTVVHALLRGLQG
jgi:adenosylhomocysteine nucleosidase